MTQATLLGVADVRTAPAGRGSPLESTGSTPGTNSDGFARALDSASREARELRQSGKADGPPAGATASATHKLQTRSPQMGDEPSKEGFLSGPETDLLESLTDKQRSGLEALVKKLQQTLEQGADPEAVMAELQQLAHKAREDQWPAAFSSWLTQKLELLEPGGAESQASSAELTAGAVSSFLGAVTRAVKMSADNAGSRPSVTVGGLSTDKTAGQNPSDLLSRVQGLLQENTQGDNGLAGSGLDRNLEEGKLMGIVKLASGLTGSGGGSESRSESISASSLTALAEASGQNRTNPVPGATPKAQPLQTPVLTGFNQPGWSDSVGQKVLWLSRQNISSAELRLDPPDLGPVNVRVSVQNDQAQVTFTSQHLAVREALDQTASRLRDMFASEGIDLVDVDVSDQSQSQPQPESALADNQSGRSGGADPEADIDADIDDSDSGGTRSNEARVSLVDDYA